MSICNGSLQTGKTKSNVILKGYEAWNKIYPKWNFVSPWKKNLFTLVFIACEIKWS